MIFDQTLLWAFADSTQLVIVGATDAKEAVSKAEKYWHEGQTITPLGILPLNAPSIMHKCIYQFDKAMLVGDNNFFFEPSI